MDDLDVQAEWDKGAIIRRVEPEWADAGRATAVNAPWTEANSSWHPARCNRPDMVSCSVNAGREYAAGRSPSSATDQRPFDEGEVSSLSCIPYFSRAEVLNHYFQCLRVDPATWARDGLNRAMVFRSYSYVVPNGRFARSIPIFL